MAEPRLSRATVLGILIAGVAFPAFAQNWTGGSGNWSVDGNWDSNTQPNSASNVVVGTGNATISGAAAADNVEIQSGGVVTVDGSGASLTATETRISGGAITIRDGGSVTNDSGIVAGMTTVSGTDGSGNASTWTNNNYFTVGEGGAGTLNILNGGKLIVGSDTSLGYDYFGEARVSGTGSSWENTGRVTIDNGILRVDDGGHVSNGLGTVGASGHGDVEVSGAGSTWVNSDQLTVGSYGSGTMLIEAAAAVTSKQGYVGAGPGVVGEVTVTGPGSRWDITDSSLTLGNYGSGSIIIKDGALVSVKDGVWLGSWASSSGTLTVNGLPGARGILETNFLRGGVGTADVTLDGGILRATENRTSYFVNFGNRTVTLDAGGGIVDTNGYNIGISPELTGIGALTKDGLGTLTLTGANTYLGDTTISLGTLQLGDGGTTGSILGDVSNNGILAFNRSDDVIFGGTIAGTGGVHQIGSGMTRLTADSSALTGVSQVQNGILSVNGSLGGTMEVIGGRLQGIGQVGGTTNFAGGTIAPGNSIGTLTIAGDYTGSGGTLEIESVLGDDASATDKLVVTGNTSGSTNVRVINLGGAGAQTTEGIRIIEVGGVSAGSFTLLGSYTFEGAPAIVAGAYAYRLYQGGVSTPADGDWYLRSALLNPSGPTTPLYQAGAPLYEAYAGVLQNFNALDTLQQRLGNRSWSDTAADADISRRSVGAESGTWGRIMARRSGTDPKYSTTGADTDSGIWQLQAGADGTLYSGDAGSLIGGISMRYGTISADVSSVYGSGSIDSTGYGLGGSLTWYGDTGFYVDAQANATWYDSDLFSSTSGRNLVTGNDGIGYAFGLEAGQQIALGGNWSLTPQAQLAYSSVDYDDFKDVFGSDVALRGSRDVKGRLGISADYEDSWKDAANQTSRLHAYGIANLYYNFQAEAHTRLSGVSLSSEPEALWGGVGLGGTYSWGSDRYAVYGEAIIDTSLRSLGDSYALTGRAGFNMRF
ncbi:autotransporter family protein [Shinella sedimenti]|uniref:Autotransporter outer membrane beta-barrel domain-containing protein n=1 Tax=Shinella sedimenti TaxID=2919913 RepID=A0ABT0CMZ4_9HYPH|nr:autotransporter outer membrane beta-barrel domain-containing protein [Shinella sedimenti]MCJ8149968.1 autotransporter outer membrane beta-barrel domain-containing protein [Shinella sedimenti]